jgi:D-alanine-D-alanine ligase
VKIKVAIMFGGVSAEAEISKKSAQVVQEQLPKEKYDSKLVELGEPWKVHLNQGSAVINKDDFSYLDGGSRHNFDFVFIAVHGHPGENGILQGYFDLLKIPYSAPNVLTSAITFNKKICSDYLRYHGITCPTSVTLYKNQLFEEEQLALSAYPVFVKPAESGSSYGIRKVNRNDDLALAIENAFNYSDCVLVEQFIEGREVTCGVYDFGEGLVALPVTEIITHRDFFDYEAKYLGESDEITPANLDLEEGISVQETAKMIYRKLRMTGVSRVDFIMKGKDLYFIEINSVPGLSKESIIPQQVRAQGMELGEFFDRWIDYLYSSRPNTTVAP